MKEPIRASAVSRVSTGIAGIGSVLMYGDSVRLPGGASLRARGLSSGASFAVWGRNPLRGRLRLLRVFAWALFFVVLAGAVLGLAQSISRSLVPFAQVPAVITAETKESRGPQCLAELAYTFNGHAKTGSYMVDTSCRVLPRPGATLKLKVNPEDPQDVVIVGHEALDRDLPLPIGLGGSAAVTPGSATPSRP